MPAAGSLHLISIATAAGFLMAAAPPPVPAPATPTAIDPGPLIAAWRLGDADLALRVAHRLGPATIARFLRGSNRSAAHAALWLAPRLDEPWSLLEALVDVAEGSDRIRAVAACRATTRIAARWSAIALSDEDDPFLESAAARLAALAADRTASADVRITALVAALHLDAATTPPHGARSELLARLLGDPDPVVRRIAAANAPATLPALQEALKDADDSVVRAAAGTIAFASAPGGLPDALLPLVSRAVAWANDASLPVSDRSSALRILRAAGRKDDRAFVKGMAKDKSAPAPLRKTASALLRHWKPVRR